LRRQGKLHILQLATSSTEVMTQMQGVRRAPVVIWGCVLAFLVSLELTNGSYACHGDMCSPIGKLHPMIPTTHEIIVDNHGDGYYNAADAAASSIKSPAASETETLEAESTDNINNIVQEEQAAGVEADKTSKERKERKWAYAAILLDHGYVPGAIAWCHSIRDHGSDYPIILLVHESVSDSMVALLRSHPVDYFVRVPNIANPFFNSSADNKNFEGTFSKLNIWRLAEFEKIIFTDLDFIFMRNVDELFEKPALSAAPDSCPNTIFNSGLMVLQPNLTTYHDMLHKLRLPAFKSYDAGDQGFLNLYFPNWNPLRSDYNVLKYFSCARGRYQDYLEKGISGRIKGIHYTGVKPWKCTSKAMDCNLIKRDGVEYPGISFFAHHGLHRLWWERYDAICSRFVCPTLTNQIENVDR